MTIEMLIFCGAFLGVVVGFVVPNPRFGCVILLAVPAVMVVYTGVWQATHPEQLRSTSALDYIFGPLWPSLGALGGFLLGICLQSITRKK